MTKLLRTTIICGALALAACSDDETDEGGRAGMGGGETDDDQTPPIGEDALEAWLDTGAFEDWHCEDETHEARSPSPHGFNRICSNDALAGNVSGDDDWPEGAAAVKVLYESIDETDPLGYAVYLKTDEDSAGGDNWYWYERIGDDIIADGMGDSGTAKSICVSCHVAAGSDPAHTPSMGGRDQVYTPVR